MDKGFPGAFIIDPLDGTIDIKSFVRQRNILHLQTAKLTDTKPCHQCYQYSRCFSVQVKIDRLNKLLFFLPFYIFDYKKDLPQCDADEAMVNPYFAAASLPTSSMMHISAASPLRAPVLVIRQ